MIGSITNEYESTTRKIALTTSNVDSTTGKYDLTTRKIVLTTSNVSSIQVRLVPQQIR